jgi:hypothetical protein
MRRESKGNIIKAVVIGALIPLSLASVLLIRQHAASVVAPKTASAKPGGPVMPIPAPVFPVPLPTPVKVEIITKSEPELDQPVVRSKQVMLTQPNLVTDTVCGKLGRTYYTKHGWRYWRCNK